MKIYKTHFDKLTKKWMVLKKEMIFIGRYTWVIEKKGFLSKAHENSYIDMVIEEVGMTG